MSLGFSYAQAIITPSESGRYLGLKDKTFSLYLSKDLDDVTFTLSPHFTFRNSKDNFDDYLDKKNNLMGFTLGFFSGCLGLSGTFMKGSGSYQRDFSLSFSTAFKKNATIMQDDLFDDDDIRFLRIHGARR